MRIRLIAVAASHLLLRPSTSTSIISISLLSPLLVVCSVRGCGAPYYAGDLTAERHKTTAMLREIFLITFHTVPRNTYGAEACESSAERRWLWLTIGINRENWCETKFGTVARCAARETVDAHDAKYDTNVRNLLLGAPYGAGPLAPAWRAMRNDCSFPLRNCLNRVRTNL